MQKTTLYLEDRLLDELRHRANRGKRESVAELVRQAIRFFLNNAPETPTECPHLTKILKQKPRRTSFGDPVRYQRDIRKDWD